MSNVLFLNVPSHGHINPTVGLVDELVRRGERVTYFASPEFRNRIEAAGADFRCYAQDLDIFKAPGAEASDREVPAMYRVAQSGRNIIADILAQIQGQQFDYLIHSLAFPLTKPIVQILKVPTIASLAVFAGLEFFFEADQFEADRNPGDNLFSEDPELSAIYKQGAQEVSNAYGVHMPSTVLGLIFNKGDLNLVYTSKYFAADITYFDDTFKFVGPPVYDRKEQVDFPFERLVGKKVLYISLGTVFGSHILRLYDLFFESFANWDGVVVLAAYGVDRSAFRVPDNFIVRDYVPQSELLRYTTVAITHCGMNSMNDLLVHEVPFVALPLGADQPLLAARTQALGATIFLDANVVGAEALRQAVETVLRDPDYRANIDKINDSFKASGGYPKAVDEIFKLKQAKMISN